MAEVDEAREFFRQQLGDDWVQALLYANAVARLSDPVPEAEDAQFRAVNLVSAKRRDLDGDSRKRTAHAWEVLWLHDALPEAVSRSRSGPGRREVNPDSPSAAVG
jgi:hypothetical protein